MPARTWKLVLAGLVVGTALAFGGATKAVTASPAASLPDLVVESMSIGLATGGACAYNSTDLRLFIVVANIGNGDA
jgi:hypothetical protein